MKSITSMDKFDIESLQENIHFKESKLYFQEVMMTYQIGAYRSSVVTLWSVVVCDIVLRLQDLIDLYNDPHAIKIIQKIKDEQNKDSKSSAWELKILAEVLKQTQLINQADFENLIYLQKQRHLCAHPTLSNEMQLYKPNKETVRALIRNTLESVLSKPPFYTDKIINTILEDLSEIKNILTTRDQVKRYIEDRYLNRLPLEVELKLFKLLWKLTFRLNNDECEQNRFVNFRILIILTERHSLEIYDQVSKNQDYYSNLSKTNSILSALMVYLSSFKQNIFLLLSQAAQITIKEICKQDLWSALYGWFIYNNLTDYYQHIVKNIKYNPRDIIGNDIWKNIFKFSDSNEWENQVTQLITIHYCSAYRDDIIDRRFNESILPNLKYFNDEERIKFLLQNIEANSYIYKRIKLKTDYLILREHFEEILPEDFDYTQYPNFNNQTQQEESSNLSSLLSDTNED